MSDHKTILVLGGTGRQGVSVIKSLLATPSTTGESYRARAFTRNVTSASAKEVAALGDVELFQGDMKDLSSIEEAMKGCYGVYANVDSFVVGDEKEIYLGIRYFEIAKRVGTVKHWVWSSLDYLPKKTGYNPKYAAHHYDAKGRVAEWLRSQTSDPETMIWSVLSTGPYMEMLRLPMFGPVNKRDDGAYIFSAPIGQGHVPMIALSDLGYYTRYIFDHPLEYSAQELKIATEMVTWPHLVETFTKVTGKPAVFIDRSGEEFFRLLGPISNRTLASDFIGKEGSEKKITFKENFTAWWNIYKDDIVERDMEMLRRINPNGLTLEKWMREVGYDGEHIAW